MVQTLLGLEVTFANLGAAAQCFVAESLLIEPSKHCVLPDEQRVWPWQSTDTRVTQANEEVVVFFKGGIRLHYSILFKIWVSLVHYLYL